MPITSKKVCLIGDFGVGKTSLVRRYLNHSFSDKYLTTVGVSIKTKHLTIDGDKQIKLIIWDIAGADAFDSVREKYLAGANALLVVADGARGKTITIAHDLSDKARTICGDIPHVLLVNKCDLADKWVFNRSDLETESYTAVYETSAKSGECVQQAFESTARQLLGH